MIKSTIYCKNYSCRYNKKLDEPYQFKFSQIYTPFEGDKCKGICNAEKILFCIYDIDKGEVHHDCSVCTESIGVNSGEFSGEAFFTCSALDCRHNSDKVCTREEILVDKLEHGYTCKCYAHSKFKGHMDWFSRFCNPDGSAKGGNIDDDYAKKIDKWQKTTRSYRTHMKQQT